MFKFKWNLSAKVNQGLESSRLKRIARYTSLAFAIMVSSMISYSGYAHHAYNVRKEEAAREYALAQKAEEMRQIVCLTNITHHEARGERPEVRKLLAKVVIAMASDPSFSKARTICDLAKIPGMFSQITHINTVRAEVKDWPKIYTEVSSVYESDRVLPPGWHCVRGFRLSDDKMETLSSKSLSQLGFTVKATGLKYFAKSMVPVDTRGTVTFYSPRGGCKNPTQTAMR
jgi:hypothetical protein